MKISYILKYVATKHDLESFVTRDEFRQSHNELLTRMDEMTTILKRLDQERVFTFEYVKRLEMEVERNRKDIDHIKDVLKIS
ncbi:MAG: hypothetical protein K6T91_09145 [Firmicutes bacterium]|nr:hypothetical protein [Bacillota bacterium]